MRQSVAFERDRMSRRTVVRAEGFLHFVALARSPGIGSAVALSIAGMEMTLRSTEVPTVPGVTEAPGTVYAFVPAHGQSNAGVVVKGLCQTISEELGLSVLLADFYSRGFPLWGTPEAPQRLDRQSWGAFLTPGVPFDTLEAREAHPREIKRLLNHARSQYRVTCADLSDAKQVAALEMLRHADWIFVVSGSDKPSLEMAKYKAAWLRSLDLEENSGLLVHRVPGGAGVAECEDISGLPVCALVDNNQELDRLAMWLAAAPQ